MVARPTSIAGDLRDIRFATTRQARGPRHASGPGCRAVLLCHVAGYWTFMELPGKLPNLYALMAHGVDVFIVISGFVLFYPVLRAAGHLDARQFFGRRALRILPAYYVGLAVAAVLAMNAVTAPYVVGEQANVGQLLIHTLGPANVVPRISRLDQRFALERLARAAPLPGLPPACYGVAQVGDPSASGG